MKRQVIELSIIVILISVIYIKDMFLYRSSQISLLQTTLSSDLKLKLEDYENIRKVNNLKQVGGFKCITRLKSRKINEFYNFIKIYNNKNCNMKKGDVVLDQNGLVGIVSKVSNKSASVKLITNSDTKLSVKIDNSYGTLYSKNGKIFATNFVNDNNISVGDNVYTSGLTDIPKDILVGIVSSNKIINNVQVFEIKAVFNLNENPYVSVYGESE